MKKTLFILFGGMLLSVSGCVRVITTDVKSDTIENQNILTTENEIEPITETESATLEEAEAVLVPETEIETVTDVTTQPETTIEIIVETTEFDEYSTQVSDDKLNLMQRVLLNQAEFIDVESHTMMKTTDIEGCMINDNTSFYCMDMDGDGDKEVSICFQSKIYSVFYEIEGNIYRIEYPFRGMAPLYTDGTMCGSSGASSGSRSKFVAFTKLGAIEEVISGFCTDITHTQHYYTGNRENEISRAEYMAIENECSSEAAQSYHFSRTNVELYVR